MVYKKILLRKRSVIETINDELFYKFKYIVSGNDAPENQVFPSNGEYYKFYRDSLGYLINEMGEITFNNHPTEEILASYQESQTLITVYGTTNENLVDFLNEELNENTIVEKLSYLVDAHGGNVVFTTSFGYEDQVITDIIFRYNFINGNIL